MGKMRGFMKWIGIIGAGILVLVLAAYTTLNIYASQKLREEIKKIKQKGEPISFADLKQAPIPDEENAATIYKKVFSLLDAYKTELDKVEALTSYDITKWTSEEKKNIAVILDKHKEIFDLLHEAALKEECNFNLDYSKGPAMSLMPLAKLRAYERFLYVRAILDKENGNLEKAVERIIDGFAVARAVRNDGVLIGGLVRIACDAIMLNSLEELLKENISYSLYQKLYDIVNKERQSQVIEFFGERIFAISVWDMIYRGDKKSFQELVLSSSSTTKEKLKWGYLTSIFHRPILKLEQVYYLKILAKVIEATRRPYWEDKSEVLLSEKQIPQIYYLSRMVLPALGRPILQEARCDAQLGAAEIALALRMYKIKKGNYPSDLTAIMPDIVRELPRDPFTGKDYIYKRKDEGFVVYSLGDNCKDDGGNWGKPTKWEGDFDIVFALNN